MNVTHPISEKILRRINGREGPVPTGDLLDLGTRSAVDKALSRLARQGRIRRVRRGLYEIPRTGALLGEPLVHSPDVLVRAWARNNGLRVVPSGAMAANMLGLSTQVPAKIVYYTNGRSQTLELGPYIVKLLNRGPKTMDVSGDLAPLVLQALRHIGRGGVTQKVMNRLHSILSKQDRSDLSSSIGCAPGWMKPVIEDIAGKEGG